MSTAAEVKCILQISANSSFQKSYVCPRDKAKEVKENNERLEYELAIKDKGPFAPPALEHAHACPPILYRK